jgi:hypothetical protein
MIVERRNDCLLFDPPMIYCHQCGHGNADTSHFCRSCGMRISSPELAAPNSYSPQPPRPYAWKTDEYQTQSAARPTSSHSHPLTNQPYAGGQHYPPAPLTYQQPAVFIQPVMIAANKSRVAYILLGLFLGGLGIHNFYAGYSGRGLTQLLLNLFLFWTLVVPIAIGIWALIEVITVDRDARGNPLV